MKSEFMAATEVHLRVIMRADEPSARQIAKRLREKGLIVTFLQHPSERDTHEHK